MFALSGLPNVVFEQIAEQLDLAVVVTDGAGRLMYVNPAFLRAAGSPSEEVPSEKVLAENILGRDAAEVMRLELAPEVAFAAEGDGEPILAWRRERGGVIWMRHFSLPSSGDEDLALLLEVCEGERPARQTAPRDFDALTGVGNRRAFDEALTRACGRAARAARPLSVLVLDLDGFREVNDTFGQTAGDAALREVGAALAEGHRDCDQVFHLGGDEFALLLPGTGSEGAARAAGRVNRDLARATDNLPWRDLTLRASMGTATFPDDAEHPMRLLALADLRMYSQKNGAQKNQRGNQRGNERESAGDRSE